MTEASISAALADWLVREQLIDADVLLPEVRFHHGGPISGYLKLVKKRAITLGDHVTFRDAELLDQESQKNWPLYAHELVHVGQYRRSGIPRFLGSYGWDMLKAGLKYSRNLALEAPAYERQRIARERLGL